MKELDQFTVEQLEKYSNLEALTFPPSHAQVAALARIALAVKTSNLNSPEIPDGWVSCSERMPEVGEHDWRTAFPMLVNCEIGVIPAYYGFTYHEGEQCFGFLGSLKFGDATGARPEQNENGLMWRVTHWMPLPAAPKPEK